MYKIYVLSPSFSTLNHLYSKTDNAVACFTFTSANDARTAYQLLAAAKSPDLTLKLVEVQELSVPRITEVPISIAALIGR